MKDIALPRSITVDVCWHGSMIVVARHSGGELVVEAFPADLSGSKLLVQITLGGNAGARIESWQGVLWLAYRDANDVGHLVRLDTGFHQTLIPFYNGQRPFAFGGGMFAWQTTVRTARMIALGALVASAERVIFEDNVPTGLSHISGRDVLSWESQRQLHPWAVGFATSGPFTFGEHFANRGLVGTLEDRSGRFLLWPEHPMRDPRLDAQDTRAAVVAWSSAGAARLAVVTAADLVLAPEQAPAPPPVPSPQPPTPEPPMSVPDRSAEAAAFLAPRLHHFPGNPVATSAATFAAVNALCIELRRTDPRWFLLVKEPGQNNVRLRGVDVLLFQISESEAQVVDVVNDGDGHDGPPSPSWQPKDIRPLSQAKEPFADAEPEESGPKPPPSVPSGSLDAAVAALIAASLAPLRAEIAALRVQLELLKDQKPEPAAGVPARFALRSLQTGKLLCNNLEFNPPRVEAFTRDGAGAWETWSLEPVE